MRFLDPGAASPDMDACRRPRWFSRDERQAANGKCETAVAAARSHDKSSPPKLAENGRACVHGQHVFFVTTPVPAADAPERDYVTKEAVAALLDMNQDRPSGPAPPGPIRHRRTGDEQVEHEQATWLQGGIGSPE
jgi:hypothetical protein